MLEPYENYISLIYGLIFLVMSLFFLKKTRKTIPSSLKNIFWSFTAFSIMKATSILSGLSVEFFHSNNIVFEVIKTLAIISSIVSIIFFFHFGISILTYKTSLRINYKIFPSLLFLAYLTFYFSGVLEPSIIEKISRYSFGFNGAFLGSIGCFNLYQIYKKSIKGDKLLSYIIICGVALIFYSITDGIITYSIFDIKLELLRIPSAIVLAISTSYIIDLLKKEYKDRIGYI